MEGLYKILAVALGGALGSVFRFLLASAIPRWLGRIFLWGTLSVNILGSLLIGIAWAFFDQHQMITNWRLFIIIGILGGFTTYSSFSLEVLNLFRDGQTKTAILYILGTNLFAIGAAFGGYGITKNLIG